MKRTVGEEIDVHSKPTSDKSCKDGESDAQRRLPRQPSNARRRPQLGKGGASLHDSTSAAAFQRLLLPHGFCYLKKREPSSNDVL